MGWKQWSVVAAAVGAGILLQIPRHEEVHEGMGHGAMEHAAIPADVAGPYRTVALEVTGMT